MHLLLVYAKYILRLNLYITLGLIKKYVNALDHYSDFSNIFARLSQLVLRKR